MVNVKIFLLLRFLKFLFRKTPSFKHGGLKALKHSLGLLFCLKFEGRHGIYKLPKVFEIFIYSYDQCRRNQQIKFFELSVPNNT